MGFAGVGLWLLLFASGCSPSEWFSPGFEAWKPPGGAALAQRPVGRAPCAHHLPHRQAFFGDLHVHTGLSMDTVIRGGRSTPDAAYRFARGEPVELPSPEGGVSRTVRLSRPLDFAAVTDHAEWLGETSLCLRPDSRAYETFGCRAFRGEVAWLGDGLFTRIAALVGFRGRDRSICGPDAAWCREETVAAWRTTRDAAEAHYDRTSACSFTTFHAWEYSAAPGRSKVHRNVLLRNEIVPELPISWIDEPEAAGLWEKLDARCNDTGSGCEAIAIPHNPNLSNGQLFVPDRNSPLDTQRRHAALRARLEPLVEIVQAKGESECRSGIPGIVGNDELCELDKVRFIDGAAPPDCGNESGRGAMSSAGCQSRFDFARYVIVEGIREQARLGVNPYLLGFIGGTDTHNGTPGATDEADYPGHNALRDATLSQRLSGDAGGGYVPAPLRNPGGLAGIWAEENSRDALFDAMKRRETFATSGTRIVPRLFAGRDLPDDFCERPDAAAAASVTGVPMGGRLDSAPGDSRPPSFVVSARRDPGPGGGPLERIQIVKGWLDDDGQIHQQVVDVAGTAAPATSLDRKTCTRRGGGAPTLCAWWIDPSYDPTREAVYYARVLETPSCRWTALQCAALASNERPEACQDDAIPWKTQERAWTSPIWVTPARQAIAR